ncbi:AAA family ATPase [Nocardia sp. IFM 10818]
MSLKLPSAVVALTVGAAGSGKSTLARGLAARIGAVVVSYDDHQRRLPGDDGKQAVTDVALAAAWAELDILCAASTPVIVDGTHCQAWRRATVRDIARVHHRPTVALVLRVPLQICQARQHLRDRQVPDSDIVRQHTAITAALPCLAAEGFTVVYLDLDDLAAPPPR